MTYLRIIFVKVGEIPPSDLDVDWWWCTSHDHNSLPWVYASKTKQKIRMQNYAQEQNFHLTVACDLGLYIILLNQMIWKSSKVCEIMVGNKFYQQNF